MTGAVRFFEMLDEYNQGDETDRARVEDEILNIYRVSKAVVAIDMSGFTRTVQELGVIHYIAMIRRMNIISREVIANTNGQVIKTDADNLTVVFEDSSTALQVTRDLFRAFADDNRAYENSRHIIAAAGIAWGDVLVVPGYDVNGNAVNLSSKLGEDIAEAGQILLDLSAFSNLDTETKKYFQPFQIKISNIEIDAYSWTGAI